MKAEHFLMAMLFIAGGFILLMLYLYDPVHAGPIPDGQYAICLGSYQTCQYEAQLAKREMYELCDEIEDRTQKMLCHRDVRRQRREDWGICRCDLACCRQGWR